MENMNRLQDYQTEHQKNLKLGVVGDDGQIKQEYFIENGEVTAVDTQAAETAARTSKALADAKIITGTDFTKAKVEELGGNIVGQQNMEQASVEGGMKMDAGFLAQATSDKITHVLTHEGLHMQHAQKNGGERVSDIRYEEAFTELGAAKETNQAPIAYQEHISYVRGKLQKSEVSETELIKAYADGNASLINEVITKVEGNEQQDLALAA